MLRAIPPARSGIVVVDRELPVVGRGTSSAAMHPDTSVLPKKKCEGAISAPPTPSYRLPAVHRKLMYLFYSQSDNRDETQVSYKAATGISWMSSKHSTASTLLGRFPRMMGYCFHRCRYFCCVRLLLFAADYAVVVATVVSCIRPSLCSFLSPEESPSCLVSSQVRHVHVNYNLCAHVFLGRARGRPMGSEHSSAQTWSCKPPGDHGMHHRRSSVKR